MSDYFPLFNTTYSPARRVFNADGMPVFARVRSGTLDISARISGTFDADPTGIPYPVPGGSFYWDVTRSLLRSSYKVFDGVFQDSVYGPWNLLGADAGGTKWFARCWYDILRVSYVSQATGFRFWFEVGIQRAWQKPDLSYVIWSGTSNSFYYYKTTSVLIPDGVYSCSTPTKDSGLSHLSVETPITVGFTES